MKILFITHHWETNSHHSKYSGYERLVHFISEENEKTVLTWGKNNYEYQTGNIKVIVKKTPKRDFFYQRRLLLSWYAHKIERKFDIIHALYCELGFFIKDKKKLITTIHVHPSIVKHNKFFQDLWLRLRWKFIDQQVIKRSNNNIAVSNNLIDKIKKEGIENIKFIPHGIDTCFWNPEKQNCSNKREFLDVLIVGAHGINDKLLKIIIKNFPQIHFTILSKYLKLTESNVSILQLVSDEKLRELYRNADVFFRPLEFATANNSILESISVGTPVITNNIPGITDYISIQDSFLASNEEDFIKIFENIIRNRFLIDEKYSKLENLSIKYSWNNIAPIIEMFYKNIVEIQVKNSLPSMTQNK